MLGYLIRAVRFAAICGGDRMGRFVEGVDRMRAWDSCQLGEVFLLNGQDRLRK